MGGQATKEAASKAKRNLKGTTPFPENTGDISNLETGMIGLNIGDRSEVNPRGRGRPRKNPQKDTGNQNAPDKHDESNHRKPIFEDSGLGSCCSGYSRDKVDKKHSNVENGHRKQIPKAVRIECWNLTYGPETRVAKCIICGIRELNVTSATWHAGHITSVKDGGTDDNKNLVAICVDCNLSMGTTNMREYIARYHPNNFERYDAIWARIKRGVI